MNSPKDTCFPSEAFLLYRGKIPALPRMTRCRHSLHAIILVESPAPSN